MWQWVDEFINDLKDRGRSAQTERAYLSKLRVAQRAGSPRALRGGEAYRASVVRHVRAYVRWCIRRGYLTADALDAWPAVRAPVRHVPAAVDGRDVERMLEVADARERLVVLLLRDTGVRVGEACRLGWSDVDLSRRRAYVSGKGQKTRVVFLSRRLVEALSASASRGTERVINLGPSGVYRMLRRVARRAGVTGRVHPHSFRHAFARDLLVSGCDLARVSRLMGHSSIAVTAHYYAVFAQDELAEAYDRYWHA